MINCPRPTKRAALLSYLPLLALTLLFGGRFSAGIASARAAQPDGTTVAVPVSLTPRPEDAPNGAYTGYLTYPEIEAKIASWKQNYPGLVEVRSLGKTYEGRDIPLVRLSAVSDAAADAASTPEVFFLGGIHPREQQPPIGLTHLGDKLLSGYGADPKMTHLLKDRVIWMVPMFNVDGKVYDLAHGNGTTRGADWRKNRHPNGNGTIGVDLNRNFSVQWGGDHSLNKEWATTTDTPGKNIYEGPAPISEPETQALTRFLVSRRGHVRAFLDLHSPLHFLHGPTYLSGPEKAHYDSLLSGMRATEARPYPTNTQYADTDAPLTERSGDTGLTFTWAYYTQGAYGFNLEFAAPAAHPTGINARYAPASQIEGEYQTDIEGPLLYLADAAGDLPATHAGHVTMADGPGTLDGKLAPGATVHWTPPALTGDWTYAVLVSENGQIGVVSEFRHAPLKAGFTIRANKTATPGASVPMTLYIWDDQHNVSPEHVTLTIDAP